MQAQTPAGGRGSLPVPVNLDVELPRFKLITKSVAGQVSTIKDQLALVSSEFASLDDRWTSPAASSLRDLQPAFKRLSDDLSYFLDQVVIHMTKTYEQYVAVEEINQRAVAQYHNALR